MKIKSFFYDVASREWKECKDSRYALREIEQIPASIVLRYHSEDDSSILKSIIWCEKHKTYEKVARWQEHAVETEEGCTIIGLFGEILLPQEKETPPIPKDVAERELDKKIEALLWGENVTCGRKKEKLPPFHKIPIRWRIVYHEEKGSVALMADVSQIMFRERLDHVKGKIVKIPHLQRYHTDGIGIQFANERIVPKDKCNEIPLQVANGVISYLKDEAERIYGKRPHMPASLRNGYFTKGKIRIQAFMKHPFDMNRWYLETSLRYYISYNLKKFSKNEEDIFPKLCKIFELKPTQQFMELYDKAPMALPIITILKILGIHRWDLVQPFLSLSVFCGEPIENEPDARFKSNIFSCFRDRNETFVFSDAFFEDEDMIRDYLFKNASYYGKESMAYIFYSRWWIWQKGEEAFAHHLLELQGLWGDWTEDFIIFFYCHYTDLPQAFRKKILQNGLSAEMYDEIVDIIRVKKPDTVEFSYSKQAEGYECELDGCTFRLVRNSADWASMWSGRSTAKHPKNDAIRMAIYFKNKFIGAIELRDVIETKSNLRGSYDSQQIREALLHITVLRWLNWTGLWKKYEPYNEEDYAYLMEKVTAIPLHGDGKADDAINEKERG